MTVEGRVCCGTEHDADDGRTIRHMCNECMNDENRDGINAVGCKAAMRRYHIVIEGYPTETVLAKDMQDAFLKSSFYLCDPDRTHHLLIYEALDGEPDYSAAKAGFCPDDARRPVAGQSFTMEKRA